jgi:glycosyltransferase involved in cell wall biosynthesis
VAHAAGTSGQSGARDPQRLRIAMTSYRSKPHCGGQGVFVRHLSRELATLGHDVEVLSGPPYPELDQLGDGVSLTRLESLDLYREPDPFRIPNIREFGSVEDVIEFASMCTAGFPEPLTFSMRAARHLMPRLGQYDLVHDNQTLGYGLLAVQRAGLPVVASVHHPITVDRELELAAAGGWRKRLQLRRWYGFLGMQGRVVRQLEAISTVSQSSFDDIVRDFRVDPARMSLNYIGVDTDLFTPDPAVARVPGRIVTTASADVPLKGLVLLIEAVAKLATERDVHLVVVGRAREASAADAALDRLGIRDRVEFRSGLTDDELVALLRSAQVAVVPSLYEGFSLPAAEAMAVGTPLVATTAGALPEVAGPDGEAALAVAPGDASALAQAVERVIDDPALAARLGAAGVARVNRLFTWRRTAERTVDWYRTILDGPSAGTPPRTATPAR